MQDAGCKIQDAGCRTQMQVHASCNLELVSARLITYADPGDIDQSLLRMVNQKKGQPFS
jgi:hypothetical protein